MSFSLTAVPRPSTAVACLLAIIAGALIPLAFAPFDLWPVAMIGLVVLALLLDRQSGRGAMLRAFCFGLGLYGVGASWIYVSIHIHGNAPVPLAALLTGLFVIFVAFIFSLPFFAYGRWFSHRPLALVVSFPLLWLLGEWLRSWFLTGFPWLYLGYGHMETWLAGWAPVLGVMGVSLIMILSAGLIAHWLALWQANIRPRAHHWGMTVLILALWPAGLALKQTAWTEISDTPISVGMVQPNIPQELKWRPEFIQPTLERLLAMSEDLWQYDWLIWPEASIPQTYHRTLPFLDEIHHRAGNTNTALISGIIYDDPHQQRYYNSLVGFGGALGLYHKRRLVPFGEYVPLEDWLRGLIHFFDMPTSIIDQGPAHQRGIQVGELMISPSVCYEVVYPDLVAEGARDAQVLLTVSNDAWFADTLGPLQHMQMARMRALETGRYLVRSTNNGISAIVDPHGQVTARSRQFVAETLSGEVYAAHGMTPFMRWGSIPLAMGAGLILFLLCCTRRRDARPDELEIAPGKDENPEADNHPPRASGD
ncbi:apolipoprotein N-acyltransferase [Marinimicrobium sp. ABcell2]|uniref:apolipoprotein N-acyltransferase n=1 Tax=Marinimicrobium sp. ABcell2 TaxID=3069751 RepID=UPI0027B3B281|nr:apolipoprotein N-acyltransferase [Marinimicrobium sp. ABcell2]MDQ2075185.1 apolipoprotein N-acyltransferase [Marinimicrobium sp. ABcell2]